MAHAIRCRPKGAGLKRIDDLFRASVSLDQSHSYSTRLQRFDGARTDSAAQHGVTIPQCFDKPGMSSVPGGFLSRPASVFMTPCIDTALDQCHLSVPGFEDQKLPAASKVSGNIDSIVCWYGDFHVQFSLGDTVWSKHPAASPRADSEVLDDFTQYLFQPKQPEVTRHFQAPAVMAK
jgi:hypothetical protein